MSGSNHLKMNQNKLAVIRANLKKIKDLCSRELFNPIIITNCSIDYQAFCATNPKPSEGGTLEPQITKLITLIPVVEQLTHTISSKRTSNLFERTKNSIEAPPRSEGPCTKLAGLLSSL